MYVEPYMGRVRAELRSPDASSNPYLVYALLIYAGLEGVEKKMPLPENMNEGAMLPKSRREAVRIAMESEFVKAVLPAELIEEYTL